MEGPCLKYAAEYECLAAPCNCIYYCLFAVINHTCVRILFALSLLLASKIHKTYAFKWYTHIQIIIILYFITCTWKILTKIERKLQKRQFLLISLQFPQHFPLNLSYSLFSSLLFYEAFFQLLF